jgi:RHS repeat-associated protein
VVWKWDSDPFGATQANEDPDGDAILFVYNLRFSGQYFDIENSNHYNLMRELDPATGRYLQADPLRVMPKWQLMQFATINSALGTASILAPTRNWRTARGYLSLYQPYAYATDNPLMYIDPFGLAPKKICEDYEGWQKGLCEACVKGFCQIYPNAIACCAIERDECYSDTGGDPVEMQECVYRFGQCITKDRKGGKKPPKPPEDI